MTSPTKLRLRDVRPRSPGLVARVIKCQGEDSSSGIASPAGRLIVSTIAKGSPPSRPSSMLIDQGGPCG